MARVCDSPGQYKDEVALVELLPATRFSHHTMRAGAKCVKKERA